MCIFRFSELSFFIFGKRLRLIPMTALCAFYNNMLSNVIEIPNLSGKKRNFFGRKVIARLAFMILLKNDSEYS